MRKETSSFPFVTGYCGSVFLIGIISRLYFIYYCYQLPIYIYVVEDVEFPFSKE